MFLMTFLKKYMLKMFNLRFIRFLFVGGFNTLLSMGIFSLLYYIGLHYTVATFITFIIGIIISFNGHKYFTFSSKSKKIYRFFGFALFFYLVINGFLYIADENGFNMYLSYIIILMPVALCNFLLIRRYVFN